MLQGHFGNFNSRVGSIPSGDIENEGHLEGKDDTKPSCGCFSRDTIANAAARAGPAVVNLSVPQGMRFNASTFFCQSLLGLHGILIWKSLGSETIIDKDRLIDLCSRCG